MRSVACLASNPPTLVSELIYSTSVVRRDDKLQHFFLPSARDNLLRQRGVASNGARKERSGTSLWNTKVAGKIKTFLWRLARHSLPSEDVRNHRKMCDTNS